MPNSISEDIIQLPTFIGKSDLLNHLANDCGLHRIAGEDDIDLMGRLMSAMGGPEYVSGQPKRLNRFQILKENN